MQEGSIDDVGDGLEPSMRVPRRAECTPWRIDHRTHLVHVDERIEGLETDAGERPPDGEALTLETARRGGDRADRSLDGVSRRLGDGREGCGISGDCGHVRLDSSMVRQDERTAVSIRDHA